jgi:glutamate transport system permease protein
VVRDIPQAPIAIMDPSNVLAQERASERELPQGGAEPLYPDHYHGSNAMVTDAWRYSHMEHGHDPNHPDEHYKTRIPESVYRKRSHAEGEAVRKVWNDDPDTGDNSDNSDNSGEGREGKA